ncbi:MAG: restriction endonuclease [Alphaproteobacteria bacterium]|nr:restriction endonuclease [Alphaproteobacteria bacterium]
MTNVDNMSLDENSKTLDIDKYFAYPEVSNKNLGYVWISLGLIFFLGVVGICQGEKDFGIFLCLLAISIALFLFVNGTEKMITKRKQIKYKILQEAKEIIDRHFDALYTNFSRSRYQDEYGYWHDERWNKELSYFFENVFFQELSEDGQKSVKDKFKYEEFFSDYFYTKVQEEAEFISGGELDEIETGEDFEDFIMDILKKKGFKVKKTPKTGDQGVDLIVRAGTDKIAIQCKFYSQPVGNKAVQEVAAGRVFYQCNKAVVVSNQTYTVSARQLAHSLGVELLNEKSIISYLESDIDA